MNSDDQTWTVTVETFDGLTASTDVLERVADALEADPTALGPAASLNTERAVLSATYDVAARSQGRAADVAIAAFYGALAAAGFDVERPGWKLKLEIEPYLEEAVPA
jgi:hypothetical protein